MLKDILIVGGTSGLGLALATRYAELGHRVTVAGRTNPNHPALIFVPFDVGSDTSALRATIDALVNALPCVNTLIYAAGYYQDGRINELSEDDIIAQTHLSITAPAMLIHKLKTNPGAPIKVMLITSSSQYTPREREPMYAATKAGLGMLGACLALDQELGKVLVIAPSGMRTPFWNSTKDVSEYLDPDWVAQQIIDVSGGPFKYKFVKILRSPARVEVVEMLEK